MESTVLEMNECGLIAVEAELVAVRELDFLQLALVGGGNAGVIIA